MIPAETVSTWWDRAECRGLDGDLFIPTHKNDQGVLAKAVCRMCPVQTECLLYALRAPRAYARGVWGGLTERERKTLARLLSCPT